MDEDIRALKQQQAQIAFALTSPTHSGVEQTSAGHAIDPQGLRDHRDTLIRKRAHQTAQMLPHIARALGVHFIENYRKFAEQNHFNSIDAITQDAIGFSRWIETQSFATPWLKACTKLDRTRCQWQNSSSWFFRLVMVSYDLPNWSKDSQSPNKKAAVWIFLNSGSFQRVWRLP